jgi:hypothetical protein
VIAGVTEPGEDWEMTVRSVALDELALFTSSCTGLFPILLWLCSPSLSDAVCSGQLLPDAGCVNRIQDAQVL